MATWSYVYVGCTLSRWLYRGELQSLFGLPPNQCQNYKSKKDAKSKSLHVLRFLMKIIHVSLK